MAARYHKRLHRSRRRGAISHAEALATGRTPSPGIRPHPRTAFLRLSVDSNFLIADSARSTAPWVIVDFHASSGDEELVNADFASHAGSAQRP